MNQRPLEILSDSAGSVALGWVAEDVFFARMTGALSDTLGIQFASYLERMLKTHVGAKYFLDTSGLKSYGLVARNAFFRIVLSHRSDLHSLVMMLWPGVIGQELKDMIHTLGAPSELTQDRNAFEKRLLAVAPKAKSSLTDESPAP